MAKRPTVLRLVVSLTVCAIPLAIAAAVSYSQPLAQVEFAREQGARRVDCFVKYRLLLLFPIGEDNVANVKSIETERVSQHESVVVVKGEDYTLELFAPHDASRVRDQIELFMSDRSRTELSFTWCPNLVVIAFLGGIGALFVTVVLLGQAYYMLLAMGIFGGAISSPTLDAAPPSRITEAMDGSVNFTKIGEWRPGERIALARRLPASAHLFLFGFGAVLGGAIGGWLLAVVGMLVVGLIGGGLLTLFIVIKAPNRSIVLDWGNDELSWKIGVSSRRVPLGSIKRLELYPVKQRLKEEDGPVEFRAHLDLCLEDGSLMLIDTDEWESSKKTAIAPLQPLADALSSALGAPLEKGKVATEPGVWDQLKSREAAGPRYGIIALALVLIVAAGWSMRNWRDASAARSRLESAGVELSSMSKSSIGERVVFVNGTVVTLQSTPEPDEFLELVADIGQLSTVKLDLTQATMGDPHVAHLANVESIVELDLSGAPITDASAAAIASMPNLVRLSVTGCNLSDEGLKQLQQSPRLRFLSISRTQVTDAGLDALRGFPVLDSVVIGYSGVTAEGADTLQSQLPGLEIRRIGLAAPDPLAAIRVRAGQGEPVPDDGGVWVDVCRQYFAAAQRRDAEALSALFSKTVDASQVDPSDEWLEIRPTRIVEFSGYVAGERATIEVAGPTPTGALVTYEFQLAREGEQWRVVQEQWKN